MNHKGTKSTKRGRKSSIQTSDDLQIVRFPEPALNFLQVCIGLLQLSFVFARLRRVYFDLSFQEGCHGFVKSTRISQHILSPRPPLCPLRGAVKLAKSCDNHGDDSECQKAHFQADANSPRNSAFAALAIISLIAHTWYVRFEAIAGVLLFSASCLRPKLYHANKKACTAVW